MRILILSILMSFGAAAGELIELTGLSDAPDPFSPAVAGQATITSRWHVMNVVPDVSNQSVDIRTVLRVITTVSAPGGTVVRTFTTQVSASRDASATGESQPVIEHTWNGKDADGNVVPDGQYAISVTGAIIQIVQNKQGGQGVRIQEIAKASVSGVASMLIDSTAPVISDVTPKDGVFINSPRPVISARLNDASSGIDFQTLDVLIDDVRVAVTASADGFTYTPLTNLPDGKHSIVVRVRDNAGNVGVAKQ